MRSRDAKSCVSVPSGCCNSLLETQNFASLHCRADGRCRASPWRGRFQQAWPAHAWRAGLWVTRVNAGNRTECIAYFIHDSQYPFFFTALFDKYGGFWKKKQVFFFISKKWYIFAVKINHLALKIVEVRLFKTMKKLYEIHSRNSEPHASEGWDVLLLLEI